MHAFVGAIFAASISLVALTKNMMPFYRRLILIAVGIAFLASEPDPCGTGWSGENANRPRLHAPPFRKIKATSCSRIGTVWCFMAIA